MTKKTHKAIGILSGLLAGLFTFTNPNQSLINLMVIYFSSVLPDFDIYLKIKHRTITHSFLFLLLCIVFLNFTYPSIIPAFTLGFGCHILADSFTNKGVQLLYPIKHRVCIRLLNTNDSTDHLIRYICYFISFLILLKYIF